MSKPTNNGRKERSEAHVVKAIGEPEKKEKSTVLKLDDTKAQILYQELEFDNYMMFTEDSLNDEEIEDSQMKFLSEGRESSTIWTLEFDGSYSL